MTNEEDMLIQLSAFIIKKSGISQTPEQYLKFVTTIVFSSSLQENEPFHEQRQLHQDHHEV